MEDVCVNGILFEGGEADTMGIALEFSAARMHFEFVGSNQVRLTPIFPSTPNGVTIRPRPLLLRRG